MGYKMLKVPGFAKYRTSDRSHVKLPARLWTKAEMEEWKHDIRQSCERGHEYLRRGDFPSALSVLIHITQLEAFGIKTTQAIDFRRALVSSVPQPKA